MKKLLHFLGKAARIFLFVISNALGLVAVTFVFIADGLDHLISRLEDYPDEL